MSTHKAAFGDPHVIVDMETPLPALPTHVLKAAFGYFYHWSVRMYIAVNLIILITDLIDAEILYQITRGSSANLNTLIGAYLLLDITIGIVGMSCQFLASRITHHVQVALKEVEYARYDHLAYSSKRKTAESTFLEKLDRATSAVIQMLDWGIVEVTTNVSIAGRCIYTFARMGLWMYLIAVIIVSAVLYTRLLQPMHQRFATIQKEAIEVADATEARRLIQMFQFKRGQKTVPQMVANEQCVAQASLTINAYKARISATLTILVRASKFLILMNVMGDYGNFLLAMTVVSELSRSVWDLSHFMRDYITQSSGYNSYVEWWNDLKFAPERPGYEDIPPYITSVDISHDNFRLEMPTGLTISVKRGSRILITGKTGGGKSTLIQGITGQRAGVTMGESPDDRTISPHRSSGQMSIFDQEMPMRTPFTKVTLRDLFNRATDDQIDECLKTTFGDMDAVHHLYSVIGGGDLVGDIVNPRDCYLNEKPSGGERSRICVAAVLCDARIHDKQMIILDEPDQGCDTETGIGMLQRIFDQSSKFTIVMVSHMCECKLDKLSVNWTQRLCVSQGQVQAY
jgi:ABC-type transport system involved in cytochrome bd biosynthesis fused ATPase/permease subunit